VNEKKILSGRLRDAGVRKGRHSKKNKKKTRGGQTKTGGGGGFWRGKLGHGLIEQRSTKKRANRFESKDAVTSFLQKKILSRDSKILQDSSLKKRESVFKEERNCARRKKN